MADVPEDVQRWTAKRRVALVLSIVRGETSVAEAARRLGKMPDQSPDIARVHRQLAEALAQLHRE